MWNYNRRKREISPSSGTSAWGRIRQIKQLGKGTYGTVWLARSSSRGLVAVKELILRRPVDVDAIENEIEIMQRIRGHGNILSLYEYYRSNTTVQLVLQYCEGGEVLDAIAQRRGLSENEAKVIMKQTQQVKPLLLVVTLVMNLMSALIPSVFRVLHRMLCSNISH